MGGGCSGTVKNTPTVQCEILKRNSQSLASLAPRARQPSNAAESRAQRIRGGGWGGLPPSTTQVISTPQKSRQKSVNKKRIGRIFLFKGVVQDGKTTPSARSLRSLTSNNQNDVDVFFSRVLLSEEGSHNHHWNRLAALREDLNGVDDVPKGSDGAEGGAH